MSNPLERASEFETFEILIGEQMAKGRQIIVIKSIEGDAKEYSPIDLGRADIQEMLQTISDDRADEITLQNLGDLLFKWIFPGQVGCNFRQALEKVQRQGQILRVCLRFESPDLATMPWEYLYDRDEDVFLANSPAITLFRYIPLNNPVRPTRVKFPLRVLLLIANPPDYPLLDTLQEKRNIEQALDKLREQVALQVIEHASLSAIQQAVREFHPHIIHFMGHGAFTDGKGCLILEQENGYSQSVEDRAFGGLFKGENNARLVILNACQSGTVALQLDELTGLSIQLLRHGLSAVVAMQYTMPDQAAIIFSREFYRSIVSGYPIDSAINQARKGIWLECERGTRDWGAPALFLRARDGILFEEALPDGPKGIEIPSPPPPMQPPDVSAFVGRDAELSRYAADLRDNHLAVITGAPGFGKTWMAARLVRQIRTPDKIFWHQFHPGEAPSAIIELLAAFIAWNGTNELWKIIQTNRLSDGRPYPPAILLNYLSQLLPATPIVLCLDDLHCVSEEADFSVFFDWIQREIDRGRISVIATSRSVPTVLGLPTITPLNGMSLDDIQILLGKHPIALSDETLRDLHQSTAGNVTILNLAIDRLRREKQPEKWASRLAESPDIQRYLLREVHKHLTFDERSVMEAVAILLGYPGSRELIETVVQDSVDVWGILAELCDRNLLVRSDNGVDTVYVQHSILQEFYYQSIPSTRSLAMHVHAAEFYETTEREYLHSAQHYEKAGETSRAVGLVRSQTRAIINQGQAQPLLTFTGEIPFGLLDREQSIGVKISQADVLLFLGKTEESEELYREAISELEQMSTNPWAKDLIVRACRGLGELLHVNTPREALAWFDRALQELGENDPSQAAYLYILHGNAQMNLGDYDSAIQSVEQGMALIPDGFAFLNLRMEALTALGNIHSTLGNIDQGIGYTRQALALNQQLQDTFRRIPILMNLGLDEFQTGDWENGIAHTQEALEISKSLGGVHSQARLELNLGYMYMCKGEDDKALYGINRCLEISQAVEINELTISAKSSLADYYLRHGQIESVGQLLDKAEEMARQAEMNDLLPEIYRHRATLLLLQRRLVDAQETIERCLRMAEDIGLDSELGLGKRVLGMIYGAQNDFDKAIEQLDECLDLLASDPYEIARTKLEKDKIVRHSGQ